MAVQPSLLGLHCPKLIHADNTLQSLPAVTQNPSGPAVQNPAWVQPSVGLQSLPVATHKLPLSVTLTVQRPNFLQSGRFLQSFHAIVQFPPTDVQNPNLVQAGNILQSSSVAEQKPFAFGVHAPSSLQPAVDLQSSPNATQGG